MAFLKVRYLLIANKNAEHLPLTPDWEKWFHPQKQNVCQCEQEFLGWKIRLTYHFIFLFGRFKMTLNTASHYYSENIDNHKCTIILVKKKHLGWIWLNRIKININKNDLTFNFNYYWDSVLNQDSRLTA